MATIANVHVGDVGTLFKGKIQDIGVPFDPTLATVKIIVWKTPSGPVEKNASVTTDGVDWYLEYLTTDPAFHAKKGKYSWQGHIEFAGGQKYSTNIEEYTVEKNLARPA